MSGQCPDIAKNPNKENPPILIDIYYPSGEPISQHRSFNAWVGVGWPFAVYIYSFMACCLASCVAREGWRVLSRK
jgi:hypothetical protein